MRAIIAAMAAQVLLITVGCDAEYKAVDLDDDGFSIDDGDCNEGDAAINPGASEIWYDGIDQNCDGNDDDKDGDGFGAVDAGGEDCWDDPDSTPEAYAVVAGEGWSVLSASEVYPGAVDIWYDGADADCGGEDDFDQDGDGYQSAAYVTHSGSTGDDCADGSELDSYTDAEDIKSYLDGVAPSLEELGLTVADINPGATEVCLDGVDQDCDGYSDWDCDEDGYNFDQECDDDNPEIFPNDAPDAWYDCEDSNCDGNDGDQDGDGYVSDEYAAACAGIKAWDEFSSHVGVGDCWDDPDDPVSVTLNPEDVNPEATETWYDGVDQDCDGNSDYDQDFDGYDSESAGGGDDCDDLEGSINPGANEICDEFDVDEDCSDSTNDVGAIGCTNYNKDNDGDGYGVAETQCYCEPSGLFTATNDDDCVDSGTTPGTIYDTSTGALVSVSVPASDINPGMAEVCNEIDDDCDSAIDDGDTGPGGVTDQLQWYPDDDGDSYGDDSDAGQFVCFQPSGYVLEDNTDCDDGRSDINTDGTEICDAANDDEDCDGFADNDDSDMSNDTRSLYYPDVDSDDYGDEDDPGTYLCDPTTARPVLDNTDCDDTRDYSNPAGTEVCDTEAGGVDEDCDGLIDNDDGDTTDASKDDYYPDVDNDGYGDASDPGARFCDPTSTYEVLDNTDCDDSRSDINTAGTEICDDDNADEDCNGVADNSDSAMSDATRDRYYPDVDNDLFGDISDAGSLLCDPTSTYEVLDNTDCDDDRDDINPDGTEVCDDDDADEDCNGLADNNDSSMSSATKDRYYPDVDNDGYGDEDNAGALFCDPTATYEVLDNTDCDDTRDYSNPAGTEVCDTEAGGVDEDCDGLIDNDDGDTTSASKDRYYPDVDNDTYGDAADAGALFCDPTSTYEVLDNTDCDDSRSDINTAGTEVCDGDDADEDCDGVSDNDDSSATTATKTRYYPDVDNDLFGDEDDAGSLLCDPTSTYEVTDNTDCDDGRSDINTDGTEVCDGDDADEDCDGVSDNDDSSATTATKTRYYPDVDNDLFGDEDDAGSLLCDPTSTYEVTDNTDCDDGNSGYNPDATEVCDASNDDEDCDGVSDNDDSSTSSGSKFTFYPDVDSDGFGDEGDAGSLLCDATATYEVRNNTDCDDGRGDINPDGTEICDDDDADEDCNGAADNNDSSMSSATKTRYYPDIDNDGFGDELDAGSLLCDPTATYEVEDSTDCDDSRDFVNTDGVEVCDSVSGGLDEDCDGLVDDDDPSTSAGSKTTYYPDADNDLFGDELDAGQALCDPTATYEVEDNTDCDDGDISINPDGTEVCDPLDQDENCDGVADDSSATTASKTTYYPDVDNDSYGDEDDPGSLQCDPDATYEVEDNTDCDDDVFASNPGNPEVEGNDLDEDCDGYDALFSATDLAYGDLIITELLANPQSVTDANGEWFEVYNNFGNTIDLKDLVIADNDGSDNIDDFLVVDPGQYVIFARNGDSGTNGGVDADWEYGSSLLLANSADDEISLSVGGTLIDEWFFGDAPLNPSNGSSLQLDDSILDADGNDTPYRWCDGATPFGDGDDGTPGAANEDCGFDEVDSADVQALLDIECAGCHIGATSGGLNLDDVNDAVGQASSDVPSMNRIESGDPDDSYLWHKLSGTQGTVGGDGVQMPKDSSPLVAGDMALIEDWILQGAPE